jgi:glycosyltransferase involved in cell wall biosynthesis
VNAIVVVSEFAKTELKYIYPKRFLKKVYVVHNPVPVSFTTRLKNQIDEIPVLLQVGTDEHKNLEGIIKAIVGLNCRLVIVGQLTEAQSRLLITSDIRFEQYADLDYSQVLEKYISADIVTFISRYEGFGMPIIEAQAVGRPVMTSTLSSLPEVAGEGAYFIKDIYNIDEIRKGVQTLLSDIDYRNQLIARGTENVIRFSRNSIAQKYISLYSTILAHT